MFDFGDHTGLLYVYATLLPLASFLLLLLAGALRAACRPCREVPLCAAIYHLLGGDAPGRGAAYIATGAIGLSCLVCTYGFVRFTADQAKLHTHHAAGEPEQRETPEGEEAPGSGGDAVKQFEHRWSGNLEWLRITPRVNDPERGTILQLGYRIDSLAATMFLMVTFIATLIHLFSIGYMSDELRPMVADHQVHTDHGHLHRRGRFGRFFLFLSLFCFSMLNLILADNLFQVFVSWELVGICSYLLIGFYYERQSAANAANKAFITNRIGDAGFIIGLLILWTFVGTFNIEDIFKQIRAPEHDSVGRLDLAGHFVRGTPVGEAANGSQVLSVSEPNDQKGSQLVLFPRNPARDYHSIGPDRDLSVTVETSPRPQEYSSMPYWLLVVAGLGIFLGCVGKSAQFPLQVWLPDAMEGPTPVSALIHAATMVAAGVYLVGRVYPLFTEEARLVIAYTGAITLFVAATIAIVMTDIKKVLAYSTVSQLGYMMLALGVGGWVAGLFHLVTHAFFKALLFLGSGSVIHGCHHEQEMTKMGGLYPKMKITALTMLVGVLTIAGIPLFSGWYSKDAILAQALGFVYKHPDHGLLFLLPLITAGITTFYMFRMWFLTFTGEPRDHHVHEHAHESPWTMTVPLIGLAFFSVVVAWGWPFFSSHFPFINAESSWLDRHIHHSQHPAVQAEFGNTLPELVQQGLAQEGKEVPAELQRERYYAHVLHGFAGNMALLIVAIGIIFASALYYFRVLDPAEAQAQFPGVHRFLAHKWYFDELYSALLVRPALVVAGWCRVFDTRVIDGAVDASARATVHFSWWNGRFDLGIVDGLVNLTARVIYAVAAWLRGAQTGYIRSYVLFLVLAAIGIFAVLSYFVALASAH